jgi:serine/threonine-protein kinase
MGPVHLAQVHGAAGAHIVVVKRFHRNLARDGEFVGMFVRDARSAARIHHPHVAATLDVFSLDGEIFIATEYVHGDSLSKLFRASVLKRTPLDWRIVTAVMGGALHGLHAGHETRDERGQLLELVHRDVSPHNILVGVDGAPRVLDFGVAQAMRRLHSTGSSTVTSKLPYTAPEQLSGGTVTRQADVYAASVIIWEALTGYRLFRGDNHAAIITAVLRQPVLPPSRLAPDVPPALDRIVMRGLERDPALRYRTAHDMAIELQQNAQCATSSEVGAWVQSLIDEELARRAALIAEIQSKPPDVPQQRVAPPSGVEPASARAVGGSSPPMALQSETPLHPRRAASSLRRRAVILSSGGAVLVACALGLLMAGGAGSSGSTPALLRKALDTPTVEPAAFTTAAAPAQPGSEGEPAAPVAPLDDTETPEPPTAEPTLRDPAARTAPGSPAARTTAARPIAKRRKADCRIPYRIDEKGHKRYKPACL